MLLMVEEGIRGRICQVSQIYCKANNKYMKNYDKNKESIYIPYFDANNLYGWSMLKPLPVIGFKWVENISDFTSDFMLNYDENSDDGYILEATIRYPKKLHGKHRGLPFFLPERKKNHRCQKLICGVNDK